MRIANANARRYVCECKEFTGNNIFAMYSGKVYVVYSFGRHFPMYAKIKGKWYGNKDRYSVSTSKHQTQTHPSCKKVTYFATEELKELIEREG